MVKAVELDDDLFEIDRMKRLKAQYDKWPIWKKLINVATVAGVESVWRNICGFALALYSAFILSFAWQWFVVPVFPVLPVLNLIQIWALRLFCISMGLYTPFRGDKKQPDTATWLEKWYRIFDSILMWSLTWLVLFTAHLIVRHWL